MEGLSLRVLDLQSNRIRSSVGLRSLVSLEELYLAYNGISEMRDVDTLTNVNTLDLTHNYLTNTNGFEGFISVEYLWVW